MSMSTAPLVDFATLYKRFAESGSLWMPPVIMEAILNRKNCSILLRVDKVVLAFINSPERMFVYSSRNNYERLLAHQLSCWYALTTESPHKACIEVIIRKPEMYAFPPRRVPVTQLVEAVQESQRVSELQRLISARSERERQMQELQIKGLVSGMNGLGFSDAGLPADVMQRLLEAGGPRGPMGGLPVDPSLQARLLAQQQARLLQSVPSVNQVSPVPSVSLVGNMMQGGPGQGGLGQGGLGGYGYPSGPQRGPAAPLILQDPSNALFAAQQVQLEEALRMNPLGQPRPGMGQGMY